ncbi:hypothetical protein RHECNPAF_4310076 [Rhizobium etli CNPAF512]|nr:hypothetical protein RHECNPAF_4310076 [Rhizobium etli CNPAF512]
MAVRQLPKAGTAKVIPTSSNKLLSKVDIPDSPHPNPLPCLDEIAPSWSSRPIRSAVFIQIMNRQIRILLQ